MPEPISDQAMPAIATAAPAANAAPPATLAGPSSAVADLAAALQAEQPSEPKAEAAPAPAAKADAPPAADLSDEEAERLALHPKVREHTRREIDKREAARQQSEAQAARAQQQLQQAQQQRATYREMRAAAADQFHEKHDEAVQWLLDNEDARQTRADVVDDPVFQKELAAYVGQQTQAAQVQAVQRAIEQANEHPIFKGLPAEQLATIRDDPANKDVPSFYAALFKAAGYLSPAEVKAEVGKATEAAATDARHRALGGWEPRDLTPSEGRAGGAADGALDMRQDGRFLLEQAYRREDARPNGRAS